MFSCEHPAPSPDRGQQRFASNKWLNLPEHRLSVCAPSAINATVIGLYYLAFFLANTLVGWIGGYLEKWPTTNFWLLHAGCAAGSGLCFVLFKFLAGHHLAQVETASSR